MSIAVRIVNKIMKNTKSERLISQMLRQVGGFLILAVTLGILVNETRSDRLPLVVDRSVETQLAEELDQNMMISIEKARESFFSREAVFLDARAPEFFKVGHIKDSRNLPWEAVEEYFDAVMANIPKNTLIITYCDGESCALSKYLAQEIFFRGYENVRVLVNGWSLWVEHQLPIG